MPPLEREKNACGHQSDQKTKEEVETHADGSCHRFFSPSAGDDVLFVEKGNVPRVTSHFFFTQMCGEKVQR